MWQLDNKTPYPAERNWVRDMRGVHHWVVAVRATFDIDPHGPLRLTDEPPPPTLEPEHYGPAGESSLRYDSELLAIKPTTDILVLGHAYAPGGRPAPSVPVVLRVGPIDKQLVAYGDRVYYEGVGGLTTTPPQPFIKQPLRYERAFGGADVSDPDPRRHYIDERNPVGRGYARPRTSLINTPAHTIEYLRGDPATHGPAGFGPIDPGWQPRRALAGTYDAQWVESTKPLLPRDYDPAFAQCAPADQRPPTWLEGTHRVALLGMSPEGSLVFELPSIHLAFTTYFGHRPQSHGPRLTTVLIEPDERRLSLVWQSTLQVATADIDYLDATRIEERRGVA